MITAAEADALVLESDAHTNELLVGLDTQIRFAAKSGVRSIVIQTNYVGLGVQSFTHPYWRPLEEALKRHSFAVRSEDRKVSYGFGASTDDDNPPRTYEVIVISW